MFSVEYQMKNHNIYNSYQNQTNFGIAIMDTQSKYWTDDLPVCHHTGAGFTANQLYRPDGSRHEWHKFNDRRFHGRFDDHTSIYAVFSGQEGSGVAEAAMERVAAEILLGQQLTEKSSEEEVRDVLR